MGMILNPKLQERIAAKVQSGEYRSADEVVEKSLDLLDRTGAVPRAPSTSNHERPIWEVIEEISRSVPEKMWDEVPNDLSKNLDHYLYGAPKVSE